MNNNFKAFEFGIRIATGLASDPVSGRQGEIYYNTTSNSLRLNTSNTPTWVSIGSPAIGSTISGATQGSVLFAGPSGALSQDNSQFFWDDTNYRLGIGTTTPAYSIDVAGQVNALNLSVANNSGGNSNRLYLAGADVNHAIYSTGSGGNDMYFVEWLGQFHFMDAFSNAEVLTIKNFGVGIGDTNPSTYFSVFGKFQVDGNGNIVNLNNVPTSFPSTQGATGTYLQNSDGAGTLVWAPISVPSPTLATTYSPSTLTDNIISITVGGGPVEIGGAAGPGTIGLLVSAAGGVQISGGSLDMTNQMIITSTTNQGIYLQTNGQGSFVVDSSTDTAGNARGINAIDLQTSRSTGTQVASGDYSALLGGQNNTVLSSSSVIAGGVGNFIGINNSGIFAGAGNNILGYESVIIGGANNSITPGGNQAGILAGIYNQINNNYSVVIGAGAWDVATNDFVIGNNGGVVALPTTAVNNHFRVDGVASDVHIGRSVNQSTVVGATNTLYFHTVNASNQSAAVTLSAPNSLTSTINLILPGDTGSSGEFLQTDGTGVTSWQAVTSTPGSRSMDATWVTGDGPTKTITHGWGTYKVIVQILDSGNNYANIELDIQRNSNNTVDLTANAAPTASWLVLLQEVN